MGSISRPAPSIHFKTVPRWPQMSELEGELSAAQRTPLSESPRSDQRRTPADPPPDALPQDEGDTIFLHMICTGQITTSRRGCVHSLAAFQHFVTGGFGVTELYLQSVELSPIRLVSTVQVRC